MSDELWRMHYNRYMASFDKQYLLDLPCRYNYLKPSYFLKNNISLKNSIIIINKVKYKRADDEDEELAHACELNVNFFKKIKSEVYPLYLKSVNEST